MARHESPYRRVGTRFVEPSDLARTWSYHSFIFKHTSDLPSNPRAGCSLTASPPNPGDGSVGERPRSADVSQCAPVAIGFPPQSVLVSDLAVLGIKQHVVDGAIDLACPDLPALQGESKGLIQADRSLI